MPQDLTGWTKAQLLEHMYDGLCNMKKLNDSMRELEVSMAEASREMEQFMTAYDNLLAAGHNS